MHTTDDQLSDDEVQQIVASWATSLTCKQILDWPTGAFLTQVQYCNKPASQHLEFAAHEGITGYAERVAYCEEHFNKALLAVNKARESRARLMAI